MVWYQRKSCLYAAFTLWCTLSLFIIFLSLLITLAKSTSALGAEKGNGVAHHCPASWALLLATLLRLAMLKLPTTAWAELFTPITRSSAVATDRDAKELNLPKRVFLWQ